MSCRMDECGLKSKLEVCFVLVLFFVSHIKAERNRTSIFRRERTPHLDSPALYPLSYSLNYKLGPNRRQRPDILLFPTFICPLIEGCYEVLTDQLIPVTSKHCLVTDTLHREV